MSDCARREREARRQAREFERLTKERAKMDERARARHEVAAHDNQIELLVSLHKECGEEWDWLRVAATLPPIKPAASAIHEARFQQAWLIRPATEQAGFEAELATAKENDRVADRAAQQRYVRAMQEWQKKLSLAVRIPTGDLTAYQEALQEFSPLAELEELGAEMEFTMHSASLFECCLTVKDSSVIPPEAKSLTSTGKLSVKDMPRARFHEIYQDYVCSAILRVARELFAILPIEHAIVTAVGEVLDTATGKTADKPVLSMVVSRVELKELQWEFLDPSDAISKMTHKGDFKASRKSGAFQAITALTPAVLKELPAAEADFGVRLSRIILFREQIKAEHAALLERSLS
jgi:hypothetical protein